MANTKSLAKQLGLSGKKEYYDHIISRFRSNDTRTCVLLFNAMPKNDRKEFITECIKRLSEEHEQENFDVYYSELLFFVNLL